PKLAKWPKTKWLLKLWWRRAGSAARDKIEAPFRLITAKKASAIAQAYFLLRQFDREISATQNSEFCLLAALFYGKPEANFYAPCRKFLSGINLPEKIGQKIAP